MDTKKKIVSKLFMTVYGITMMVIPASAQYVEKIQFCSYDYGLNNDSITLYFNLIDGNGEHVKDLNISHLTEHLKISETGREIKNGDFQRVSGGIRIPKEQTISVLVDRGIDRIGKEQIYEVLKDLVNSTADSCIFLSFFDKPEAKAMLVKRNNLDDLWDEISREPSSRYFYNALYHKLKEFNSEADGDWSDQEYNAFINQRARHNKEKNAMFVFIDGQGTDDWKKDLTYSNLTLSVRDFIIKPTIFVFYYTSDSRLDEDMKETLEGITGTSDKMDFPKGKYVRSDNHDEILKEISEAQENLKYDFAFIYRAEKQYKGEETFAALWDDSHIANDAVFTIGTKEHPWPKIEESGIDLFLKFFIALFAAVLTIAFFFIILKIVIPFCKSKAFEMKYYNKYQPEYGIQRRICCYCRQPINSGDLIVNKCEHIMHVQCWKEHDYQCAEYGQNCKTGIQEHVDWKNLLSKMSFRDCHQAISGICAGFFSWVVYELIGRGACESVAAWIAKEFISKGKEVNPMLTTLCTSKVASFLAIGLLLGFFLSLIFRYNEEYRKKNFSIYMKILGLSVLSSLIGFLAFAVGGIILCMMQSPSATTVVIPWYTSFPAYLLFSVCTALSLTISTSIPIKSAMLGGLCSSVIGFIVLYFSNITSNSHPWMNMLLDLIIYGGGLGASLVTVRMLAEKYFLVILTGAKKGVRIPIHKWMNATGGGNKVTIGLTNNCEIQMNWEKSNKVAKEHATLFIDQNKSLPMIKPLATGVIYNSRAHLPVNRPSPLINGDTFKIGDTEFRYEETD